MNIDPVQFGRMIGTMEAMTNEVRKLSTDIDTLTNKVQEIEDKFTGGRGMLIGLAIASGGMGAGFLKFIESLFK